MSSNSYLGIEPWGPPENFDLMVKYLIDTLPREELLEVYEKIQKDPSWSIEQHFGYGLFIRNHLRKGGYDSDDIHWFDVLCQASMLVNQSRQ
jgi:hypothetical protein